MARMPRSRTASSDSTTRAAAPMPMIMPLRRRSKGRAARRRLPSGVAAPLAIRLVPIHCERLPLMTSSPAMMMTRRARPRRIQSSAMATAWVVEAQAALTCVLGPRARCIRRIGNGPWSGHGKYSAGRNDSRAGRLRLPVRRCVFQRRLSGRFAGQEPEPAMRRSSSICLATIWFW